MWCFYRDFDLALNVQYTRLKHSPLTLDSCKISCTPVPSCGETNSKTVSAVLYRLSLLCELDLVPRCGQFSVHVHFPVFSLFLKKILLFLVSFGV